MKRLEPQLDTDEHRLSVFISVYLRVLPLFLTE